VALYSVILAYYKKLHHLVESVKVVTRRDIAWSNRVSPEMDRLGLSLCAVPSCNHLSYISEKSCQKHPEHRGAPK
jgi:hypothetical protein